MNNQNKEAGILPSGEQVTKAIRDNAPVGIAAGVGLAGLVNVLQELRRNRDSAKAKSSQDILEVPIPVVSASKSAAFLPTGIGSSAFSRIPSFFSNITQLIKQNPGTALRVGIPAAAGTGLGASAIIGGVQNAANDVKPSLLWNDSLNLAALGGGAALSYGAVNGLVSAIRKKREQQRLESAKAEYAKMLGEDLVSPKTAEFPLCEEVSRMLAGIAASEFNVPVNGTTKIASAGQEVVAGITSAPTLLALLALAAGHKYMYDREQSAIAGAKAMPKKIKPPTQIRLVAADAPKTQLETAKSPNPGDLPAEGAEKTAAKYNPIAAAATELAMGNFLIHKAKESEHGGADKNVKINPETGMPFEKRVETKPKSDFVDENTLVVNTPTGATIIDATDPQTLALLKEKQKEIAQRMEAASVLPATAANH